MTFLASVFKNSVRVIRSHSRSFKSEKCQKGQFDLHWKWSNKFELKLSMSGYEKKRISRSPKVVQGLKSWRGVRFSFYWKYWNLISIWYSPLLRKWFQGQMRSPNAIKPEKIILQNYRDQRGPSRSKKIFNKFYLYDVNIEFIIKQKYKSKWSVGFSYPKFKVNQGHLYRSYRSYE